MKSIFPYLFTIVLFNFTGCIPSQELVDCAKEPNTAVCLNKFSHLNPPRIYVDPPFGASFTCVLLGCEQTVTLEVSNKGSGYMAIAEITLANNDNTRHQDYRLIISREKQYSPSSSTENIEISPETPYNLREEDYLYLHIIYQPTDGLDDFSTLSIKWFNGHISYNQSQITQTELPVTARILNPASGQLNTEVINFGYIPVGTTTTNFIKIHNTTQTDAVLDIVSATNTACLLYTSPRPRD